MIKKKNNTKMIVMLAILFIILMIIGITIGYDLFKESDNKPVNSNRTDIIDNDNGNVVNDEPLLGDTCSWQEKQTSAQYSIFDTKEYRDCKRSKNELGTATSGSKGCVYEVKTGKTCPCNSSDKCTEDFNESTGETYFSCVVVKNYEASCTKPPIVNRIYTSNSGTYLAVGTSQEVAFYLSGTNVGLIKSSDVSVTISDNTNVNASVTYKGPSSVSGANQEDTPFLIVIKFENNSTNSSSAGITNNVNISVEYNGKIRSIAYKVVAYPMSWQTVKISSSRDIKRQTSSKNGMLSREGCDAYENCGTNRDDNGNVWCSEVYNRCRSQINITEKPKCYHKAATIDANGNYTGGDYEWTSNPKSGYKLVSLSKNECENIDVNSCVPSNIKNPVKHNATVCDGNAKIDFTQDDSCAYSENNNYYTIGCRDNVNVSFEPGGVKYGDVNLDGVIDTNDSIRLMQYLNGSISLNDKSKINADVNRDGQLTNADNVQLMKYISEWSSSSYINGLAVKIGQGFKFSIPITSKTTCNGSFDINKWQDAVNKATKARDRAKTIKDIAEETWYNKIISELNNQVNEYINKTNAYRNVTSVIDNSNTVGTITIKYKENGVNKTLTQNFETKQEEQTVDFKKISSNEITINGVKKTVESFNAIKTSVVTLVPEKIYFDKTTGAVTTNTSRAILGGNYFLTSEKSDVGEFSLSIKVSGLGMDKDSEISNDMCPLIIKDNVLQYRIIDVGNPFGVAKLSPGLNWANDKYNFVKTIKENIWSLQSLYEINLSARDISDIKNSNSSYNGSEAYLGICKESSSVHDQITKRICEIINAK